MGDGEADLFWMRFCLLLPGFSRTSKSFFRENVFDANSETTGNGWELPPDTGNVSLRVKGSTLEYLCLC